MARSRFSRQPNPHRREWWQGRRHGPEAADRRHRDREPRTHLSNLPFSDTADFTDADRGFIGALEPCVVKAADGRVVWDNDVYSFLQW